MPILIFIATLFLSTFINSKEPCKYVTFTTNDEVKYTEQKSIRVSDVEDHFIRIFKTETKHKNSKKNCENLKLSKTDFFGISDYTKKNGEVSGYSIGTYSDGSKIFSRLNGISHTPLDQTQNGLVTLTISITGGTGKYKGIAGYGKGKTEFNPETGYSSGKTEIFYMLRN